ncbi:unnamed protein product [Periconia digitata]|uniref:BTB domain-containing protein n=1 Tax=Periconia digitata TaxID=1303443 RepID=A0A9W4UP88_9PLEO|nr:unnamed protein product [Periconia digitata]
MVQRLIFFSRLDCDFITVVVGDEEEQRSFKIHEDVICDRSSFFRSSMKPEWASMRSDPRTVELPEDSPNAFALYRTWLYSRKLPILPTPPTESNIEEDTCRSSLFGNPPEHYHTLAHAYVLGERLLDIQFKNTVMDTYVLFARGATGSRYYPTNDHVRIIYDGTTEGSPIRKFLVDIWYCRGKVEWIENDGDLPQEFLAAVVREMLRARQTTDNLSRPWKLTHTQYHEKE